MRARVRVISARMCSLVHSSQVGTTHNALHIYDVATFRCFLSPDAGSHHQGGPIGEARWATDGSLFVSCCANEVKLWDGHSCKCVATMSRPHGGATVGSVQFSRNGSYVLSSGADSALKLWDVRMLREAASAAASAGGGVLGRAAGPTPVRVFEGATQTSPRRVAAFSHDEALVLSADEATGSVVLWAAGTGELAGRCIGHACPVHNLVHACGSSAFVSTGEDGALRAWATSVAGL